jgi:hypothetical protein
MTWPELRRSLRRPRLLVLDDLGAEGSTSQAFDRARELLQLRYRDGKLTLVTTNVTAKARLSKLLGARVESRSRLEHVQGADLRTHQLRPPPPEPTAVSLARRRVAAIEDLERALRSPLLSAKGPAEWLETWLREITPHTRPWDKHLEAVHGDMQRRSQDLDTALSELVESLSKPPDPDETARELERASRDKHLRKLETLAGSQEPATLREAIEQLEQGEQTRYTRAAVAAMRGALDG